MKHNPHAASPADTREEILTKSGRRYTVVRKVLCQRPGPAGTSIPSVLGPMVTERKRRSLQLYLLLLTVWPWLQNQTKPLAAAVWARALSTSTGRQWTATNVSEAWTDLENRDLIERRRLSRGVVITPRREDGRAAYRSPGEIKNDHEETYFSLPPEFWRDELFETLSLPAIAMLLVIASRTSKDDETWLTNKDAGAWYALSPRSVEGGIKELEDKGLLTERIDWIKAPLSPIGATKRHYYSLTGPFSTTARLTMQGSARVEFEVRTAATKKPAMKKTKKVPAEKTATKKTSDAKTTTRRKRVVSRRVTAKKTGSSA